MILINYEEETQIFSQRVMFFGEQQQSYENYNEVVTI